jgi:hypothetical protein
MAAHVLPGSVMKIQRQGARGRLRNLDQMMGDQPLDKRATCKDLAAEVAPDRVVGAFPKETKRLRHTRTAVDGLTKLDRVWAHLPHSAFDVVAMSRDKGPVRRIQRIAEFLVIGLADKGHRSFPADFPWTETPVDFR